MIERLEQVDERYGVTIFLAWELEDVLGTHGCPGRAELAGNIGDDLNEDKSEFWKNLEFAKHVAATTKDTETLEYMTELAEIETSYLSDMGRILSDIRDDGKRLGCWP